MPERNRRFQRWGPKFRFVNDSGGGDDGGGDCGGGGCHGSAGGGRGYQAPPIIGGSSRNAREIYPGMNGCQKTPENREAEHAVLRKRQHSKNEAAVPGIADPTERRHMSGGDERGGALVGPGTAESDERLVALLRKRPKNVPQVGLVSFDHPSILASSGGSGWEHDAFQYNFAIPDTTVSASNPWHDGNPQLLA